MSYHLSKNQAPVQATGDIVVGASHVCPSGMHWDEYYRECHENVSKQMSVATGLALLAVVGGVIALGFYRASKGIKDTYIVDDHYHHHHGGITFEL